jgi:hypothetical protein
MVKYSYIVLNKYTVMVPDIAGLRICALRKQPLVIPVSGKKPVPPGIIAGSVKPAK